MKSQSINETLLFQRKLKGLTQSELSDQSGIAIRTIQRIEKGEAQPHMQTIKLLAEALNVSIDELVVLENPKEESIKRKWMLLIHASPFSGFIIPLANVLFPLFTWMGKAEDNPIYDKHGREVVNFYSSLNLYLILSLLLFFIIPGYNYFITAAIILFGIIVGIRNIFSSLSDGSCYYPISLPFMKTKQ